MQVLAGFLGFFRGHEPFFENFGVPPNFSVIFFEGGGARKKNPKNLLKFVDVATIQRI